MCVSAYPVTFSKTITGIHEAAEGLHVTFYANNVAPANTAGFRSDNPETGNALLLPIFGAWDSVQSVDLSDTPNVLRNIRSALSGPSAAFSVGDEVTRGHVVIEQVGIYTVVRARNASYIYDAVQTVEARKRPALNKELFDKLAQWYRDIPFAVCCFDSTEAAEASPVAFSYKPLDADNLTLYMLDGHDGNVPNLDAEVDVDHTIFVSSYRMEDYTGMSVFYTDEIPEELKPLLPTQVIGGTLSPGTKLINGDLSVRMEDVLKGELRATRIAPPNAPQREPEPLKIHLWS